MQEMYYSSPFSHFSTASLQQCLFLLFWEKFEVQNFDFLRNIPTCLCPVVEEEEEEEEEEGLA